MIRLVLFLVVFSITQGNALKCYECDDFDLNEPRCDDVIKSGVLTECRESLEGHPYCMSFDGKVIETKEATGEKIFEEPLRLKNCSHINIKFPEDRVCQPFNQTEVNGILVGSEQEIEFYDDEYIGTLCFCNGYDGCNNYSTRPMVALWSIVLSLFATVKLVK